ncbi:hypothetical protein ACHAXA_003084 [Cyclostephanos tholiformis]|uniref:Sphingomyelin synthase-like domain-containing protein n=1 Tax=Cyclostephanos tholiformis TaxID=382380 RepID=A0ABD3SSM4_9STRA
MAKARNVVLPAPPPQRTDMNIGEYDEDNNDKRSRGQWKWTIARCIIILLKTLKIATSFPFSAVAAVSIVACLLSGSNDDVGAAHASTAMKFGMGYIFVARPLLSTLHIIFCFMDHVEEDGQFKPKRNSVTKLTRLIASSFLMSIVCNQFPKWLSSLVACLALFFFGLASRQVALSSDEYSSKSKGKNMIAACDDCSNPVQRIWSRLGIKERAALAAIILTVMMLTENFATWVVSATYEPGISGSAKPLQDNGRIVLERLAMKLFDVKAPWMARTTLQKLRDGLNVQWALVTSFGTSLVCLELGYGRNHTARIQQRTLAGLTLRALVTLALARLIRTISFSLTVLPSQVNNCYASHFPPPPDIWSEWLVVGFLPNSRGGCNDLILSGHATFTSTITCAFTSAASNTQFSIAVWTLVALDYSIESYQGLHYSVDMWLGCIVTCLLWQITKPLEFGGEAPLIDANERTMPNIPIDYFGEFPLTMKVACTYALPAAIAFVALTLVPEAFVNYIFVGYSVWAGVIFFRCGFTSFLQHVLLCELCIGLGAYL